MPFSLEQFQHDHDTVIFPVKIGRLELRFHKPRSIDPYLDPNDVMRGFPMWSKLWEASAVLVQHMAELPVDHRRSILELGSGLGVAGITAAAMGHDVTLTEYDPNALMFLQANVAQNNCERAKVHRLDWFQPDLEGDFDLIIGSELVYQEAAMDALGGIFERYLRPQGRVILAERVRSTGTLFFDRMAPRFHIQTQKHSLRSKGRSETVVLFEMTPKEEKR
jgi:predicted nicotinamide N-methyase